MSMLKGVMVCHKFRGPKSKRRSPGEVFNVLMESIGIKGVVGDKGMRGPKGVSGNMHPLLSKILIKYYFWKWCFVCFFSAIYTVF